MSKVKSQDAEWDRTPIASDSTYKHLKVAGITSLPCLDFFLMIHFDNCHTSINNHKSNSGKAAFFCVTFFKVFLNIECLRKVAGITSLPCLDFLHDPF